MGCISTFKSPTSETVLSKKIFKKAVSGCKFQLVRDLWQVGNSKYIQYCVLKRWMQMQWRELPLIGVLRLPPFNVFIILKTRQDELYLKPLKQFLKK